MFNLIFTQNTHYNLIQSLTKFNVEPKYDSLHSSSKFIAMLLLLLFSTEYTNICSSLTAMTYFMTNR